MGFFMGILRSLVFLSSSMLLLLGIFSAITGIGGTFGLITPQLDLSADMLKLPPDLRSKNMQALFRIAGIAGYATVNLGTIAICAASGRRRVHSGVAAVGAGAASVVFYKYLVRLTKPHVDAIGLEMDKSLVRYYEAYRETRDEKFLSQIHLQNSCCGLHNGPRDFAIWGLKLPSSCCGHFTGICNYEQARSQTCVSAIKALRGSDGIFGLTEILLLVAINCVFLAVFLLILFIVGSQDTVHQVMKVRQTTGQKFQEMENKEKISAHDGRMPETLNFRGKNNFQDSDAR